MEEWVVLIQFYWDLSFLRINLFVSFPEIFSTFSYGKHNYVFDFIKNASGLSTLGWEDCCQGEFSFIHGLSVTAQVVVI